jgi:hypothetical protein
MESTLDNIRKGTEELNVEMKILANTIPSKCFWRSISKCGLMVERYSIGMVLEICFTFKPISD